MLLHQLPYNLYGYVNERIFFRIPLRSIRQPSGLLWGETGSKDMNNFVPQRPRCPLGQVMLFQHQRGRR